MSHIRRYRQGGGPVSKSRNLKISRKNILRRIYSLAFLRTIRYPYSIRCRGTLQSIQQDIIAAVIPYKFYLILPGLDLQRNLSGPKRYDSIIISTFRIRDSDRNINYSRVIADFFRRYECIILIDHQFAIRVFISYRNIILYIIG